MNTKSFNLLVQLTLRRKFSQHSELIQKHICKSIKIVLNYQATSVFIQQ